jgi:hypothetical protein
VFYVRHAFLWDHGAMQDLGTLGCSGACVNPFSSATDINDAGDITGLSILPSGTFGSFLWSHGRMSQLAGLAPNDQVEVAGINNPGDAIGNDDSQNFTPLIWRSGSQPTSLAQTCAGLGPSLAINNCRTVLSYSNHSPATPFFVPQICRQGTVSFLPPVGPASGDNIPVRMNNLGAVVGSGNLLTSDGAFLAAHAVLWAPDSNDCD